MGTQILLVGEGSDVQLLARRLEAVGYEVACTSATTVLDVMGSLRPSEVLITPGVPTWQRTQISTTLADRYPGVRIVLLRKRSAVPNAKLP